MKRISIQMVFLLLCFHDYHAQKVVHNLDFMVEGSRQGIFNGLAYRLGLQKTEVSAGVNYEPVSLIRDSHFASGVFFGVTYNWLKSEKLAVGSSLLYHYKWNISANNKAVNTHAVFYSYRITVGNKWRFFHELGLGAHCRTANLDKPLWLLDGRLSLGIAYVF
jgi:hypothetical protein